MSAGTRLQGTYPLIVIGAGLTGLFAGALAARRGARPLVLARGLGGTHTGAGTIDVWGWEAGQPAANPLEALARLADGQHPLKLIGLTALRPALDELKALCAEAGYTLAGRLEENFLFPTPLGAGRPTCLAPESFAAGDLRQPGEMALAHLAGFRDFFADLAAANLRAAGHAARAVPLELPDLPLRRDAFATDIAHRLDEPAYRAEVARRWRPRLEGVRRLGVPAVLGTLPSSAAWRELQELLGVPLFEIPTLPPSVPGMRLFSVLRRAVESQGGRVLIGPGARGWVEPDESGRPRALGVIAETAGGPRAYQAEAVILASGGFRHGGLHAPSGGRVQETVFGLPVQTGPEWFAPRYDAPQPYARFGLRVNAHLQPVDEAGRVVVGGLFAAGGILAGADRLSEGSREGLALASAWAAVAQALGANPPTEAADITTAPVTASPSAQDRLEPARGKWGRPEPRHKWASRHDSD